MSPVNHFPTPTPYRSLNQTHRKNLSLVEILNYVDDGRNKDDDHYSPVSALLHKPDPKSGLWSYLGFRP